MRCDGSVTVYQIEHWDESQSCWQSSNLGHFLYPKGELRTAAEAEERRELIKKANDYDVWSVTGVHGTQYEPGATACAQAMKELHPDRRFRIARRTYMRSTPEAWEIGEELAAAKLAEEVSKTWDRAYGIGRLAARQYLEDAPTEVLHQIAFESGPMNMITSLAAEIVAERENRA